MYNLHRLYKVSKEKAVYVRTVELAKRILRKNIPLIVVKKRF